MSSLIGWRSGLGARRLEAGAHDKMNALRHAYRKVWFALDHLAVAVSGVTGGQRRTRRYDVGRDSAQLQDRLRDLLEFGLPDETHLGRWRSGVSGSVGITSRVR